ncbi:MAG: tetratricopeptide repeat protein [Planctomycetes bacterium]|nr:tetratricopeptide repeat protein [Planctomycetota bacterium]
MSRAWIASLLASFALLQGNADEQYAFIAGLAEKNLHQQVAQEAQRFLTSFPRHAKVDLVRYRLACARFELHQTKEARADFAALLPKDGFEFAGEVAFRLGQCALDDGDCKEATRALERAVAVGRDYLKVPARWLLGEAHQACKDLDAAAEDYRVVLETAPTGEYADDALAGSVWCAYQAKRFADVDALARRYGESYANGERAAEMRYLRGEALLELARPKEALELFASVRDGELADGALRGAGFAQAALGDHSRAAQCFAKVVESYPRSRHVTECALQAGIEWLAAKRSDEALRCLSSPAAGDSLDVLSWRARAQAQSGDHGAALATLDRALPLAKDDALRARLQSSRADELSALGRKDEALAEYRRAGDDYALQAAAVASLNAKRYDEAAESARRLLERFPQSQHAADARLVLGEAELASKHFAQAEQAFAAAETSTDPTKRLHARSRRAWCKYLAGDARGAEPLFTALSTEKSNAPEVEEAAFMAARSLEAAGDAAGALAGYDRYSADRANGAKRDEAALRAATLDGSDGATARFERLVREARDADVALRARFELAERLSRAGRHDEAANHYRAILERASDASLAPAARYGLAWCLHARGDVSGASELLHPLLGTEGLDETLRASASELAIWCAAKQGKPDELLAAWRVFAASKVDDARCVAAARLASESLRRSGRGDDARTLLASLEQRVRDPKSVAALAVERVYLHLEAKDVDRAERALAEATAKSADDPAIAEAAFFVGEARWDSGERDKALALYDRAAKNERNQARDRALYKSGFARLKAGDLDGAERAFATLVEALPQSPLAIESWFLLGETRFRARRFPDAIAALEHVAKEAPRHEVMPKVLFRLGLARVETGDWQGAVDALGDLAKRAPSFENTAEAELARGRALAKLGRGRDARAALERTLALDQGLLSARAHLELGRIAEDAGDHEGALSEFLKVAVLYDAPEENALALVLAGNALEAQGDKKRAAEQYREVVEKFGSTKSAATARERLKAVSSEGTRGL